MGTSVLVDAEVTVAAATFFGSLTVPAGVTLAITGPSTASTIGRLEVRGIVDSPASLTVTTLVLDGGLLTGSSGTISATGSVSVSGTNPSTIAGGRFLALAANAVFAGDLRLCDSATLLVIGTITQAGSSALTSSGCSP